jgi:hypothetical protein
MMAKLEIRLKKSQAKPFKMHLEKEHPMTRGKITIKHEKCRRRRSKPFTTASQVRDITKSAPNFKKIAAKAVRL